VREGLSLPLLIHPPREVSTLYIQNTMKYIHMIHFKDDEFEVATATTVEEIKELVSAGFGKVDEIQGIHIFRRPKRFAGYS
jgi:hypothetical protein